MGEEHELGAVPAPAQAASASCPDASAAHLSSGGSSDDSSPVTQATTTCSSDLESSGESSIGGAGQLGLAPPLAGWLAPTDGHLAGVMAAVSRAHCLSSPPAAQWPRLARSSP